MAIDNATLLQVNTSAIVGIFIFLTLQGFGSTRFSLMQTRAMIIRTSLLVIPFAFSAIAILIGEIYSSCLGNILSVQKLRGKRIRS